jgi:general secretion pathway protein G
MRNSMHCRRRGFTLVEVLVVMAILVLLAGLVVPRILGSKKRANIDFTQTQIGTLKGALEYYANDMNDFPTTEQGLVALLEEPDAAEEGASGAGKWNGPYLKGEDLPIDPWGNAFQYEYPPTHGKGQDPEIWSYGPDGQDDTEDDIVSWKRTAEGGEEFAEGEGTGSKGGGSKGAGGAGGSRAGGMNGGKAGSKGGGMSGGKAGPSREASPNKK